MSHDPGVVAAKRHALCEWRDSLNERRCELSRVIQAIVSGEIPKGDIQAHTVRIMAFQDEDSLYESEVAEFTSKHGPVDLD